MKQKAAFCFCCRYFSQSTSEQQFKFAGYKNWQHAVEENKGFAKIAASAGHVQAALIWAERQHRITNEQSVSTLVHEKQLERNRYYIRSIAEVVQFLCINELPCVVVLTIVY